MNPYRFLCLCLFFALSITIVSVYSQISYGGIPPGYSQPELDHEIARIAVEAPDTESLLKEDELAGKWGAAPRVGVLLPVQISASESAYWKQLKDGSRQWRVRIHAEGAPALGLYYKDFYLPEGCSLFIYNALRTQLIGAFTHSNNHESGLFANELIAGEDLIVELIVPSHITEQPEFVISEVLYAYNKESTGFYGFGDSGACNVNINCSEGANWQDQKRGVVRLNTRVGSSVLMCTGSLINNTKFDFKPYLFTADHCARTGSGYASAQDLNQWLFYFNYESETCTNPAAAPPSVSMTGASLKANVGGGSSAMGSDFYLVLLNNNIPPSVNPYYNGWSRINSPADSGFCIHHPSGDIKKISTYTTPTINASWNANTPNMYWQVKWSATANGHGVTEGGSSGSPLFNKQGLIIGQLTGGESACNKLTSPDYYGKFAVSWESIGSTPDKQLKPWLDPQNLGLNKLQGTYDTLRITAIFVADTTVIQTGRQVGFENLSLGEPTDYHWIFQGGEPAESFSRNPGKISYKRYGEFDVTLIISNQLRADTLVRTKYIKTVPGIFPNPAKNQVNILLGSHEHETIKVEIYNMHGIKLFDGNYTVSSLYSLSVDTNFLRQGVYVINLSESGQQIARQKLIIARY